MWAGELLNRSHLSVFIFLCHVKCDQRKSNSATGKISTDVGIAQCEMTREYPDILNIGSCNSIFK